MAELGDRVNDNITGFKGIVTCKAAYLNGCERCVVTEEKASKEGDVVREIWIDEIQLSVIKSRAKLFSKKIVKKAAGPRGWKI